MSHYERNGFRLSDSPSRIERPTPLLGEHTREILRDCLGCSESTIDNLAAGDALQ